LYLLKKSCGDEVVSRTQSFSVILIDSDLKMSSGMLQLMMKFLFFNMTQRPDIRTTDLTRLRKWAFNVENVEVFHVYLFTSKKFILRAIQGTGYNM
jgi:hypothetical protein